MDQSTVKLKTGDILIQRGTNHAWVNRSDQPARVAFVLIDAEPLGIGHPVTGREMPGPDAQEPWPDSQGRNPLDKQFINPPELDNHPAYSRVITVKGPCKFIFIAGQTPSDENYKPVAKGDYKAQYER